jgi:hypothetical protein
MGANTIAAESPDAFGYAERQQVQPGERDLTRMDVDTRGERGGLSYASFDAERDRMSVDHFEGFRCLGDCAGHEAGWSWAAENSISTPSECGGNSWSFTEGCVAYALENPAPANDQPREVGLF